MADTIRNRILDAVVAALNDHIARPVGATAHRSRARPQDTAALPAAMAYLIDEPVKPEDDLAVERTLRLRLEHQVAGSWTKPGATTDELLEPMLAWGTAALLSDTALAALITDINESTTQWAEPIEADKVIGAAAQDFLIQYTTLRVDQTQAG